jgi:hypothetical protein
MFCESANDSQEDLVKKIAYNLNIKVIKNKIQVYIFGYLLEPRIEIWQYILNFVGLWLFNISKNTWF